MDKNTSFEQRVILALCENEILKYTGPKQKHLVYSKDNFEITPKGKIKCLQALGVVVAFLLVVIVLCVLSTISAEETVELGGVSTGGVSVEMPKRGKPTEVDLSTKPNQDTGVKPSVNTKGENYASVDDVFINPLAGTLDNDILQQMLLDIKSFDFRLECRDYEGRLYREYQGTIVRDLNSEDSHLLFSIDSYTTTIGIQPSDKAEISADLRYILVDSGQLEKIAGGFKKGQLTVISPDNKKITEMYCTKTDVENQVIYCSYISNIQY